MKGGEELEEELPEKEELDWWSKYYASMEEMERQVRLFEIEIKPSVWINMVDIQ